MCDRPPGLSLRPFALRNPMKSLTPARHGAASVSESNVTFARGLRPLADARGSVGRALSRTPVTQAVYAGGSFSTLSPLPHLNSICLQFLGGDFQAECLSLPHSA
jgi:hypothetical protein